MTYYTIDELRRLALTLTEGYTRTYIAGRVGVSPQVVSRAFNADDGTGGDVLARVVGLFANCAVEGPEKVWTLPDEVGA